MSWNMGDTRYVTYNSKSNISHIRLKLMEIRDTRYVVYHSKSNISYTRQKLKEAIDRKVRESMNRKKQL